MSQQHPAISVKKVKKNFLLPHERTNSIKRSFTQLFQSKNRSIEVQHALKGISFDIKEGEFFGILGRNGSGKSTLLKILAQIYTPSSGKVAHHGKLVPFIELGVGFNPELTGRENVFLNGALLGFSKKEIAERYDEIVAFAELEAFMDQKLKNYSSGMQVRLAFSVATRAEADILLVDEVLAVGDADFQRKCYDYFKSLKKTGKTVVFVTHDMSAVREYCDRAILINDGVITHEDTADRVANEYLKLFNKSEDEEDDQTGARWGNGQVRFDEIKTHTTEETVTINMNVKAKKTVEDVVIGVRIQDNEGVVVAGVNTKTAENGQVLSFTKGENKHISFTMQNIFGTGTYTVGAAIRLTDKVTFFDNWDGAAHFQNTKDETFYPIVCPTVLSVTESARDTT